MDRTPHSLPRPTGRIRPGLTLLICALAAMACSVESTDDAAESTVPEASGADADRDAPQVYFVDAAGETSRLLLWRAGVEGVETVVAELPDAARGLAWVWANRRLYVPSRGDDVLLRGTLDGAMERLPLAGLDSAYAVVVGPEMRDLYLSDYGRDEILRVDLDGTSADVVVSGLVAPRALTLDRSTRTLYWVDRGAGRVQSIAIDGGEVRTLVDEGLPAPYGIEWDGLEGMLLVADAELGAIFRVDPSLEEPVLEEYVPDAGTHPSFLALDGPTRTLYWTDNRDNVLRRMPVAGGPIEVLAEGLAGPRGLVLHRPLGDDR